MSNTLVVSDVGPFSLDLHQSDPHAPATGKHTVRVRGGLVIGKCNLSATWEPVHATDVVIVNNATTYIEINGAGGIVSNQSAFTGGAQKLYAITVASGNVTAIDDVRFR